MVETGLPKSWKKTGLAGVGGSSAKGILLVLSALAVCFGYFYFFTDIFRSKDEIAGQRDIISSEVRKTLPARNIATPQPAASPTDAAPSQPSSAQPQQQPDGKAPAVEVKTKQAPSAGPSKEKAAAVQPVDVQKPVAAAKIPKPQVKPAAVKPAAVKPAAGKATTVNATEKPSQPSAALQKNGEVKPAGAGKAGSTPGKTGVQPKTGTSAEKTPAASPAPAAAKKTGGAFTLVVGTYVMKSSMSADKAKLERAGIKPVSVVAKKRNEPMNRLHVADFSTQPEAQAELNRIKATSSGAFVLKENGRYALYAGSYYAYERAMEVREQLNGKGINSAIRKSVAPVSAYTLTAGSFSSREDALEEASRLQKLGFKPFVSARK